MKDFDAKMMEMAISKAAESPVSSRKVGTVIVSASGKVVVTCNDLPSSIHFPINFDLDTDEAKTYWVEHAERAAIYTAAAKGISLTDATMFSTLFPCSSCMRAIIASEISTLVSPEPDYSLSKWSNEFKQSMHLLEMSPLRLKAFDLTKFTKLP